MNAREDAAFRETAAAPDEAPDRDAAASPEAEPATWLSLGLDEPAPADDDPPDIAAILDRVYRTPQSLAPSEPEEDAAAAIDPLEPPDAAAPLLDPAGPPVAGPRRRRRKRRTPARARAFPKALLDIVTPGLWVAAIASLVWVWSLTSR